MSDLPKQTGAWIGKMPRNQAKYLLSAIALGDADPKNAQAVFDPKVSYKKYNQQQKLISNSLFFQGKHVPKTQKTEIQNFMLKPKVQQETKNHKLLANVSNYLPKNYQLRMEVQHFRPQQTVMTLSKAIKLVNKHEMHSIINKVAPKRLSYNQNKEFRQKQHQLMAQQYHSDLVNGSMVNSELRYNGKNYFNHALRTYRFHPNLLAKLQNRPAKLSKFDKQAQQRLDNVANNVTISMDGKTKIPNGQPLDQKQKSLVTNFFQNVNPPAIQNGLVSEHLWKMKKLKRDEQKEHQQNLKKALQKAEQNKTLPTQRGITMEWYHKLSQPGKQYLRLNAEMASTDPQGYQKAMKTYRKDVPYKLKFKFNKLHQLETGSSYRFGKPFHIPQVPSNERTAINKFMTDKRNKLLLLSGTLVKPIHEYDKKYSPDKYNEQMKEEAPEVSPQKEEDIRQLFLNIKPRTRRYFTRLATYASRDLLGTRRLLYTHKIPYGQLDSTEQYKRNHLQQMRTGRDSKGDQIGTPLPKTELAEIDKRFFDPNEQKLWGNGTYKKVADQLNNGDHSIDHDVNRLMEDDGHGLPSSADMMHQFTKCDKLYDSLDGPTKMYMTQALQQYALDPQSFKRNFVAHLTQKPKYLKALSVSERNKWTHLQGIPQGLSPDSRGNMIPTGQASRTKDKYRVDYFLSDPKNQKLLRSGLFNKALNAHQTINQDAENHPNLLERIGSKLSTVGMGMRGSLLQTLNMPSRVHHFSTPKIGGHTAMLKHDLARDEPGMDR